MGYTFSVWVMKSIMVLFFVGLGGCALAVLFSWISIFGTVFKSGE